MNELILYPNSDEIIKIEPSIFLTDNKLLPIKENDTSHEKNYEIELSSISDYNFEEGLSEYEKTNYLIAATSGVLSGIINVLWSKDYDIENAQKWGNEKIEKFVSKIASMQGCKSKNIKDVIKFLEDKYPIQADKYTNEFGGGLQHHLRDFAHHPTIIGLISSILTQFGVGLGTDKDGNLKIITSIVDDEFIGKSFAEKIFNGIVMWGFHLISDMAGSSSSPSGGTGIPGVIISTFKEISALPIFKEIHLKYKDDDIGLSVFISKLFNGTYFKDSNGNPIKIDFRTELGALVNQSKSVLINEIIVRALYFFRGFYKEITTKEIKSIEEITKIDFKEVLPIKNKMLNRMLTISSGVFVLIDLSKSIVKSKGEIKRFLLNINYVGLGRFVFACVSDFEYLEEDVRETLYKKYFSDKNTLFDFKILSLNEKEARLLYSLELELIKYDLLQNKNKEDRQIKELWCKEWQKTIEETLNVNNDYFITDEQKLYSMLKETFKNNNKFYILVLELFLFKPYFRINNEKIKKYKLISNYFKDVFKNKQECLDPKDLEGLIKAYKNNNFNILQKSKTKIIIGASATLTSTIITGGLGYVFAPQIAVAIMGNSFAGLSGAALTSASLAAVGGGSVAVGGLGMAGGTAILAGGGALLGMAGSSTTTLTAILNGVSNINALKECSKLLTYSEVVLKGKLNDCESIESLKNAINEIINKIESELKNIKDKKKLKGIKQNLKYLRRCSKALDDLIQ